MAGIRFDVNNYSTMSSSAKEKKALEFWNYLKEWEKYIEIIKSSNVYNNSKGKTITHIGIKESSDYNYYPYLYFLGDGVNFSFEIVSNLRADLLNELIYKSCVVTGWNFAWTDFGKTLNLVRKDNTIGFPIEYLIEDDDYEEGFLEVDLPVLTYQDFLSEPKGKAVLEKIGDELEGYKTEADIIAYLTALDAGAGTTIGSLTGGEIRIEIYAKREDATGTEIVKMKRLTITDGTNKKYFSLEHLGDSEIETILNGVEEEEVVRVDGPNAGQFIMGLEKGKVNFGAEVIINNNLEVMGNLNASGEINLGNKIYSQDGDLIIDGAIFKEGGYLYEKKEGNELATSKELSDALSYADDLINGFEIKLSSFYATMNLSLVRVNASYTTGVFGETVSAIKNISLSLDDTNRIIEQKLETENKNNYINEIILDFSSPVNNDITFECKAATYYVCESSGNIAKSSIVNNIGILENEIVPNEGKITLNQITTEKIKSISLDFLAKSVAQGKNMYFTLKFITE